MHLLTLQIPTSLMQEVYYLPYDVTALKSVSYMESMSTSTIRISSFTEVTLTFGKLVLNGDLDFTTNDGGTQLIGGVSASRSVLASRLLYSDLQPSPRPDDQRKSSSGDSAANIPLVAINERPYS